MSNIKAYVSDPVVLLILAMALIGVFTNESVDTIVVLSALFWLMSGITILSNAFEKQNAVVTNAKCFAMVKLTLRAVMWGPFTHKILR